MRKYLYLIKKQKIKSWLKFWLLTRDKVNYILSEIVEGTSFNLQNTVKRYFKIFNIFGNSVQDGTPTPTNPVTIESVADDVNLFDVGVKNDYRNYTDVSNINWLTVSNDKLSIVVQADGATMCYNSKQYLGNKTYTITAKTSMVQGRFYVKLRNSTDTGWLTDNDITISNMSYNSYYNGWFIQNQTNTTLILTVNIPDCLYCVFGFGFASDSVGTTQTISNIKLQEGTVATPYSPYNYGTFTIDFEGQTENYNYTFITEPLRSLPNGVRDSLEADGIHRRVGRVVFDGTEPWQQYGNNVYFVGINKR